ncbi:hypothetical protein D3C81_1161580 [compost metagenome]
MELYHYAIQLDRSSCLMRKVHHCVSQNIRHDHLPQRTRLLHLLEAKSKFAPQILRPERLHYRAPFEQIDHTLITPCKSHPRPLQVRNARWVQAPHSHIHIKTASFSTLIFHDPHEEHKKFLPPHQNKPFRPLRPGMIANNQLDLLGHPSLRSYNSILVLHHLHSGRIVSHHHLKNTPSHSQSLPRT